MISTFGADTQPGPYGSGGSSDACRDHCRDPWTYSSRLWVWREESDEEFWRFVVRDEDIEAYDAAYDAWTDGGQVGPAPEYPDPVWHIKTDWTISGFTTVDEGSSHPFTFPAFPQTEPTGITIYRYATRRGYDAPPSYSAYVAAYTPHRKQGPYTTINIPNTDPAPLQYTDSELVDATGVQPDEFGDPIGAASVIAAPQLVELTTDATLSADIEDSDLTLIVQTGILPVDLSAIPITERVRFSSGGTFSSRPGTGFAHVAEVRQASAFVVWYDWTEDSGITLAFGGRDAANEGQPYYDTGGVIQASYSLPV